MLTKIGKKVSRKALWHIVQYILCLPVLVLFFVLWMVHILLMLPLLILSSTLNRESRLIELCRFDGTPVRQTVDTIEQSRTFSRLNDISKIYGCNVRNVQYRWKIFTNALGPLKSYSREERPKALDFGAGSLRDTWELCSLGFDVTAVDYSTDALNYFYNLYDWTIMDSKPVTLSPEQIATVQNKTFNLVTAFDVLEHLENIEDVLLELRRLIATDGLLFVTVPNRRSLYEMFWKLNVKLGLHKSRPKGEYHLQFLSPDEWNVLFQNTGFKALKHEMSVGPLVNDAFSAFYRIPIGLFVDPVVSRLKSKFGITFLPDTPSLLFCPSWLMEYVNDADEILRPIFEARWGWNLFLLAPSRCFKSN